MKVNCELELPLPKEWALCFLLPLLHATFSSDCPRVSLLGSSSTKRTTTFCLSYSKKKGTTLATTKAVIEQLSFSIELSIALIYENSCSCSTVCVGCDFTDRSAALFSDGLCRPIWLLVPPFVTLKLSVLCLLTWAFIDLFTSFTARSIDAFIHFDSICLFYSLTFLSFTVSWSHISFLFK